MVLSCLSNCCLLLPFSFRGSLSSHHPLQFWGISVAPHPQLQTPGTWCLTLWPHFCFDCIIPHLHSFFSSPYIRLCPLPLLFPLCIPSQPCTCHCTITVFLLSEGEDVPEMLALVLVFILLTVCRECRRLYHDLERQSEKWLEAETAAVLSMEPAVVIVEHTAGRGLWGEMHNMSNLFTLWHMWWKAEWTQLLHCKGSSPFLCACH